MKQDQEFANTKQTKTKEEPKPTEMLNKSYYMEHTS